ncbi:MAG: hypothetical protein AAFY37_05220 [Pseudomonadota bacterium]
MLNDIATNKELLDQLHKAAKRQISQEELHAQRVSFILGNLPQDSDMTKADVEKVLQELEGTKVA